MKPHPKRQIDPNTIVLFKHIGIGIIVISAVALIVTGVWYGTRISALTITDVEVSGGETIQHEEIEQRVQTVLNGEYVGLIPRRFAWLYPEKAVYEEVRLTERLHNVQIVRKGGKKLQITFDEYVPHALWCQPEQTAACLFLDIEGYAFAQAPKLTGGSFLRFITPGREIVIGEKVVEKDIFDAAQDLVHLLTEHHWYISQIEIDQAGDVYLGVVGGGELKVNVKVPPQETVNNLLVLLSSEMFQHIRPGNFSYIDLRFGDKVYVNEELLENNSVSTTTASSTNEENAE